MTSLPIKSLMALSAPAVPMFALMMPLVIFIPPYYAEHMGLGMASVGAIFTLGRLFDVVTDPFAGVIMDRSRRRVPKYIWVVAGAVPLSIATYQIFFAEPPGDSAILMVWLLVLYAGWTLMSVGLYSWASEVTDDYHERSRVMGALQMANTTGTILVLLVPAAVEIFASGAEVDRLRIHAMAGTILIMLPIGLLVAWLFAPKPEHHSPGTVDLLPVMKHAWRSKVLRRLIAADFGVGLSIGVFTAMSVFFAEIVLGLEGRAGILQLSMLSATLLGLPVFVRLAGRIEKHRALSVAVSFSAIGALAVFFVPPDSFGLALICYVLFGLGGGGAQMLPRAIMSDVLDEDSRETGAKSTGLYFSFLTTTLKLGLALGVGITFGLAELGGFDPTTARQDDSAHWVIRATMGGFSIAIAAAIVATMWRFPLGRSRQETNRQAIETSVQRLPG